MSKTIFSLDLGTMAGVARFDPGMPAQAWSENFKPGRFEGGGIRFVKFAASLDRHFARGARVVAFEEIRRHMGVDAAHIYGGFLAVLTSTCEALSIPYTGIPVGTIKKHATGKGNASKEQMIEAARERWPHVKITDDNVADALWVGDYARLALDGE